MDDDLFFNHRHGRCRLILCALYGMCTISHDHTRPATCGNSSGFRTKTEGSCENKNIITKIGCPLPPTIPELAFDISCPYLFVVITPEFLSRACERNQGVV